MTEHVVQLAFEDAPCKCLKHHSPKPLTTEQHHPFPDGEQRKIYGKVIDNTTIPLCDTGHKNVHVALSKWLKGQPCELPNKHQRAIAYQGYQKIMEARK